MWTKTSNRKSGRPASRTRTRTDGSADSRLARTQPADPPPTMTKSYRAPLTRPMLAARVGPHATAPHPTNRTRLLARASAAVRRRAGRSCGFRRRRGDTTLGSPTWAEQEVDPPDVDEQSPEPEHRAARGGSPRLRRAPRAG